MVFSQYLFISIYSIAWFFHYILLFLYKNAIFAMKICITKDLTIELDCLNSTYFKGRTGSWEMASEPWNIITDNF